MSFSRRTAIRKHGSEKGYGAVESPTSQDRPSSSQSYKSGSGNDLRGSSNDPLPKLQHQVDEVKDILRDNIEKVVERDAKVGTLVDRTENLRNTTTVFKENATTLRKSTQRRNWKLICCLVVVIIVVLAVITLVVLYLLKVI